jgi:hypothetical protein
MSKLKTERPGMKKLFLLSGLLAVVLLATSCRQHERCPAYGKVQNHPAKKSV